MAFRGGPYIDTDALSGMRKEDMTREQRVALANRQMEDSSASCMRLMYETMDMATETSEELERQSESLDRTEAHLDGMEVDLECSKRRMREVKSMFGSLKNHFTKPKFFPEPKPAAKSKPPGSQTKWGRGGGGEGGGKKGGVQAQKQASKESTGNAIVDKNLDELEWGLRQLEGQAYLMGSQLDESDAQVERIKTKMDRNNIRIKRVTRDINGQLH